VYIWKAIARAGLAQGDRQPVLVDILIAAIASVRAHGPSAR